MNYEKLLEENKIEKIVKKELDLSLAERDLKSARDNFDLKDFDWALSIVYNSVLQAGRALMFSLGFRPKGRNQHKSVFEFLLELGIDEELIYYFDSVRKTRHIAIYDEVDYVSENFASEAIEQAELFVHKIRTFVQENRTGDLK